MEGKIIGIKGKYFSNNMNNLVINGQINVQASSYKYCEFKMPKQFK
jgi:hypothetical protein